MSYLLPILSLSQDNLSGVRRILVVRAADVSEYPESYEGIAQSEIAFTSGRDWVAWAATYTTAGFFRKSEDSMEGVSGGKELSFIIPRHEQDITRMLHKAERDEFIVLVEDFNGQRYLFGSKSKPVRFSFDQTTGSGRDRNQYACRFYSDSPGNYLIYPIVFGEGVTDFSSAPAVIIRRGSIDGPLLAIAPAGSTVVIVSPYSFGFQILSS
jgi:hypothetical protein